MNNLKYRRQFLFTPIECRQLEAWQIEKIDNHFIYVHPDCQFEKSSGFYDLYLIGYILNPHAPEETSKQILDNLSNLKDVSGFPKKLYSLAGRFVLIIKTDNDFIFFNDACGFRTVCYTKEKDNFFAASQPLLINEVISLKKIKTYEEYFNSEYVANNIEHYLPSGVTLYENVFHLVPNHYVKASESVQKRYYPFQKIKRRNYAEGVIAFSTLLKKIILAAHNNLDLTFSLTAGWDTRIILSGCKDIARDITFYTLRYRDMDDKNMDIRIPRSLSESLNLNFDILDCQKDITPEFAEIYEANSYMAHINDWGKIAFGMSKTFPGEKVAVKGSCSEVGRCSWYPDGKHKAHLTDEDLLQVEKGWRDVAIIREAIRKWHELIKGNNFNYPLMDLYYWEHHMGAWQAQSQLEWDIVQEVFTPFNSREMFDIMFSIDPLKRKYENPALYFDTVKYLWPEVLSEPVNPYPFKQRIRLFVYDIMSYTGLLNIYQAVKKRKN